MTKSKYLNKAKDSGSDKVFTLAVTLKSLAGILGIIQREPKQAVQSGFRFERGIIEVGIENVIILSDDKIEQQINERLEAKKNKDWGTADKIRDELKQQGIVLEDVSGGTNWRRE